ncbi:outer membrane beta-barrel protein [Mucilaginibacter terrae]|uniref:outer membrane beta-barrel protein n=1 Tax=Mucilaginibacter terrae TaxID=1955052 RepID=UPI0036295CA5
MKFILLLLTFCLLSYVSIAQNAYSVKGTVTDTASNAKLANTTISVLNAKDSTLYKFTRATANGSFSIGNLKKGEFILLVTYPKYADYVDNFTLDSVKTTHNFGQIDMILKTRLLASVMVKGTRAAIKIKGDTTEFNASSFTVQPNAKVEDLLKQLPGIQIDKDGKITAQGQTVSKVLVDGEEFFGDDPTLVTKNLRADMVDKVQLYDKASDQAAFTGIDDGQKSKTINIKLKEDKKNGYFGKADIGVGTKDFYQAQVAVNKFAGKEKISAYGTLANTGKTGLGWEDANKFGTSSNNVEFVDGGITIFSGGGDDLEGWGGRYNGEGIPVARAGGAHYDNKWNADKQTINGNYKIGSLSVVGDRNNQTQNNLPAQGSNPASIINTNGDQRFDNYIFRQKADATYNLKIDSTSNIKLALDGTFKNTESRNTSKTLSVDGNGQLLNNEDKETDTDGDQKTFNFSAFYTKKLKKAGRTLSVNLSQSTDENDNKGFLYSNVTGKRNQLTDQYKINKINTNIFNSNITYSEPFSKTFSMIANYGIGLSNSTADRKAFSPSIPNPTRNNDVVLYNNLVDSVSNNYRLDQLTNQGGLVFNYKKDKTTFNFGTKVAAVRFEQLNKINGNEFDRNFINWNPQATYQYRFSQQKSFRFSYNGSTRQPTIDQIQPIINNANPLYITIGNPDLTPSFTNRFSTSYSSYKVLSNRSIWISGSYSITSNPIVSNVTANGTTGFTTSQAVNLSGESTSNFNLYGSIDSKVKFLLGINTGLGISTNGNTYFNMVNGVLNRTRSNSYSATINLQKYKEKKFDMYATIGPTYTYSVSSLNPDINNNGGGFTTYHQLNAYLPGKFQIGTDGNYEYRAPTSSFNQSFSRFLVNAYLQKAFFKDESLKLKANVNDIFNQNSGFERRANGNTITQSSYTTIKRYAMLSLIYDFSKMGGSSKK